MGLFSAAWVATQISAPKITDKQTRFFTPLSQRSQFSHKRRFASSQVKPRLLG